MKISRSLLIHTAILAVCGLFLAGCGGGGGGGTATTVNGISVPPEPDATQNNATLAGVDSNSNGVRDDVERKIAENSSSPQIYEKVLLTAKSLQEVMNTPAPTDRTGAISDLKKTACSVANFGDVADYDAYIKALNVVEAETLNNQNRKDRKNELKILVGGGYTSEELNCD